MPASPTANCFSAARRVTDLARPLVSSSNGLFISFLSICCYSFCKFRAVGLGRNVGRAPPRSRGCSRVELTRPHRAAQLSAGFFALPEEAHAVVDALFACRRLWISLRFVRQPEAGQRHARESDAEFLQRCATRDRLGQALGEFIELIVHVFPFVFVVFLFF